MPGEYKYKVGEEFIKKNGGNRMRIHSVEKNKFGVVVYSYKFLNEEKVHYGNNKSISVEFNKY